MEGEKRLWHNEADNLMKNVNKNSTEEIFAYEDWFEKQKKTLTMNGTIWQIKKCCKNWRKIDLKERRKMSKVVFNADESVLRQWEQVCLVVCAHNCKLL